MKLTPEEQEMLDGKHGKAARKSMEILTALGEIFDAECMVDVHGVQIVGSPTRTSAKQDWNSSTKWLKTERLKF